MLMSFVYDLFMLCGLIYYISILYDKLIPYFNMNVCYYLEIRNNFIYATIMLLRSLIQGPYLLMAIQNYNSKTFNNYKLFSFVNGTIWCLVLVCSKMSK